MPYRRPRSRRSRAATGVAGRAARPACLSVLRISRDAELVQERVALELGAESRLGAVAGVDDGFRRKPLDQTADRLDERAPVAVRDVGPPDGAGEEHVPGEKRALGVVGDVAGRVAWDVERLERDFREPKRLATVEEDIRVVRAEGDLREPVLRLREDRR